MKEQNEIFSTECRCLWLLRIHPLDRPREGDRLADVLDAAHPGDHALGAHPKAGVGHGAILAQFQIPFEGFFGQIFVMDAFQQQVGVRDALRAAADLAVAFGGQQVHALADFGRPARVPCRRP